MDSLENVALVSNAFFESLKTRPDVFVPGEKWVSGVRIRGIWRGLQVVVDEKCPEGVLDDTYKLAPICSWGLTEKIIDSLSKVPPAAEGSPAAIGKMSATAFQAQEKIYKVEQKQFEKRIKGLWEKMHISLLDYLSKLSDLIMRKGE